MTSEDSSSSTPLINQPRGPVLRPRRRGGARRSRGRGGRPLIGDPGLPDSSSGGVSGTSGSEDERLGHADSEPQPSDEPTEIDASGAEGGEGSSENQPSTVPSGTRSGDLPAVEGAAAPDAALGELASSLHGPAPSASAEPATSQHARLSPRPQALQPPFRTGGGGGQPRQHEPQPRRQDSGSGHATQPSGPRLPQPIQTPQSAAAKIASVGEAVIELQRAITMLKNALDKMEEVLETLEDAELQKQGDEREIEKLRETIRQLNRPREGFGTRDRDRDRDRDREPRPMHRGPNPQAAGNPRLHRAPVRPAPGGQPASGPAPGPSQERDQSPRPPREEHPEQVERPEHAEHAEHAEHPENTENSERPQEESEVRRYE